MKKNNEKPYLEFVGFCDQLERAKKVYVTGGYAFVVSDNPIKLGDPEEPVRCTLYIINISDSKNPVLVSSFEAPGGLVDVSVKDNFVVLAEAPVSKPKEKGKGYSRNQECGGVRILDISEPMKPHEVGFFHTDGFVQGCSIRNGLLYIVIKDSIIFAYLYIKNKLSIRGRLLVIDISKPEAMKEVGRLDSVHGFKRIFFYDNLAFIIANINRDDYNEETDLCIIDTSEPTDLKEIKTIEHSEDDTDVFVDGGLAYLIQRGTNRDTSLTDWYYVHGGLRIIDISNIQNPKDIGWINEFNLEAVAPVGIIVVDKHAIIAHHSGLEIIDVGDPKNPISLGSYKTKGEPRSIFYNDGLIYIADDTNLGIYRLTT